MFSFIFLLKPHYLYFYFYRISLVAEFYEVYAQIYTYTTTI